MYCQVGRTLNMQTERQVFYKPERILEEVSAKVKSVRQAGEAIDYLSFVPDGEPTLDANLGRCLEMLQPLSIKTAVITNASLIWREDVRAELMNADWVSLKVDSVIEKIWRKTNRPRRDLRLDSILDGILQFRKIYGGELVTETMLVKNVNDGDQNLEEVARFLARLKPARAYLSIPIRPPAEKSVHPPEEEVVNRAYQILSSHVKPVEYLIGYEGDAFASSGNVEENLLSTTAVHPMREEAVKELIQKSGSGWKVVQELIKQGRLIETEYEGQRFYVRRFAKRGDEAHG
ncbi:MAG: radical SAM protein [Spirochaetales bacterium]|nr:radical SAM protein [Spirochaetales bacterium]